MSIAPVSVLPHDTSLKIEYHYERSVLGDVQGGVHHYHGTPPRRPAEELLKDYLVWLRKESTFVRLTNILKNIAEPGKELPQLPDLYTELNTDLDIPKALSLQAHLRQPRRESHPDRPGGEQLQQKEKLRDVTVHEALGLHDRLVLIGDAGSGKSTVGQFLALALSSARLGDAALLPRLGPWWTRGELLPVPLVLRQFASWLPATEETGCARDLWNFVRHDFERNEHSGWEEAIKATAQRDGALFLLDGWDETRDPVKLVKVAEALASFMGAHQTNSRFLLASRPYAWQTVCLAAASQPGHGVFDLPPKYRLPWMGRDASDAESDRANTAFQERARRAFAALQHALPAAYTVDKLDPDQTGQFIGRWYAATKTWWGEQEAHGKEQALRSAMRREDLAPIAQNPLLLTLAAAASSSRLPDDRADLFNEIVVLLLQRWTQHAEDEKSLRDALDPQLSKGLTMEALRGKIEACAFEAHAGHLGKSGVADIPESVLETAIASLLGGSRDQAAIVLDFIEKRAGLLLGKGLRGSGRQFSCPHRAFQEFLAGCHVESRKDFEAKVVELARQDAAHWNDALCYAARLAKPDRGSSVAYRLVHEEPFESWAKNNTVGEVDWRCAVLAARQLQEIGLNTLRSDPDQRRRVERVAGWLAGLIEKNGLSSARERAEVGVMLADLGDPRAGVGLRSDGRLPDIVFEEQEFPPGEFVLGEKVDGKPLKVVISQPYRISRYPVTVAQFRAFAEGAKGYDENNADAPRWWGEEGWQWKVRNKIAGPEDYAPVFQTPNHPRVGVSWHEATAFCAWLTEQLRAIPEGSSRREEALTAEGIGASLPRLLPGEEIRLPHEGEWEQAACWNGKTEGRRYFPWGGGEKDPDLAQKCNMGQSGIGHTSAVDLFPGGRAACGALDLSGNVWEWCHNRHDEKSKEVRVLRGGSWVSSGPALLSCSSRYLVHAGDRFQFSGFRCVVVGVGAAPRLTS